MCHLKLPKSLPRIPADVSKSSLGSCTASYHYLDLLWVMIFTLLEHVSDVRPSAECLVRLLAVLDGLLSH
jgi:hypothetical protein